MSAQSTSPSNNNNKKQTITDFVHSNVDFEFKNLALVTPKQALEAAQQQTQTQTGNINADEQQLISKNSSQQQQQQQQHRDNAFQKIFYLYIQSADVLPKLKEKLAASFFPNESNDSHKIMLSFDAEWYQPKGAHFTDWGRTKISLLQIGLKCCPVNLFSVTAQNQAPDFSVTADGGCSLVLVFDIFAGNNLSQNSPSLRSFLSWLFRVTASQPRLGFDVRCDAKVLNALGIELKYNNNNNNNNQRGGAPPPPTDRIIDLQLAEILASARPINQKPNSPPFICMVPGLAKLLRQFENLAWLADVKQALKIRDNAEKMSLDHFLQRPIDIETMVYTVADAGMLFNLFEEMTKKYQVQFSNPAFVESLLVGGHRYANLPRQGVEPKYDDNAFLPLGILDRIDNGFCGNTMCSKCNRTCARNGQPNCVVCNHIMLRWRERD